MVIMGTRHSGRGRQPLSRDEIVTKGEEAERRALRVERHPGPWLYRPKVKSGRRATRNSEYQAWNKAHLFGLIVMDHAREGEALSAYGIIRVMKMQMRSAREDF